MLRLAVKVLSVASANHVKELSEHLQRDQELSGAAPSEKRRDREAGADGGEVIIGVHGAAIREVGAWGKKRSAIRRFFWEKKW